MIDAVLRPAAALRGIASRREVRQAGLWTGAGLFAGFFGLLTQSILASELSVAAFAAFGFSLAFLQFAALFFDFGLFVPAAREVAQAEVGERRRLVGAALVTFLPIGLAFSAFVFATSFVVDDVFKVEASEPLRAVSILAAAFPFVYITNQLAQGADRLHVASVAAAGGAALTLVGVVIALSLVSDLGATGAIVLRAAGLAAAAVFAAVWLRPRFDGVAERIRGFIAGARSFGFGIYLGRVLSVGTFNIDILMLAALADVQTVAVYTLARALSTFVAVPGDGIGATLFPRMVSRVGIPARNVRTVVAVSAVAALGAVVIAAVLAGVVLPGSYSDLPLYVAALGTAYALRGVTALFAQYLAAQKQGRALRNAGLVLTAANVALNATLIPLFAGAGAAAASVIALAVNFDMHLRAYRRHHDGGA